MTMDLRRAVGVLHAARTDRDIVVTSMGVAREWMALGALHPLDFVHVPSSMGQTSSLALGIALARPDLRVIACIGDGSLLMNLGSLVTIASAAPPNLTVLLFENGVYEVTGAQRTPATNVDFEGLARASGFSRTNVMTTLAEWQRGAAEILCREGPTFTVMKVDPVPGARGPRSPSPGPARARAFAEALART